MNDKTFYEKKFYEGILKIIFYKTENRERIEKILLSSPLIEELHFLQLEGFLEKNDCFTLTEKGLSMLDNSYNIGRMDFVKFIFALLRTSQPRRASFISRLLNIAGKDKALVEESARHLTLKTIETVTEVLRRRRTEANHAAISTSTTRLRETRAKNDLASLK